MSHNYFFFLFLLSTKKLKNQPWKTPQQLQSSNPTHPFLRKRKCEKKEIIISPTQSQGTAIYTNS